jgi:hypothetical protein
MTHPTLSTGVSRHAAVAASILQQLIILNHDLTQHAPSMVQHASLSAVASNCLEVARQGQQQLLFLKSGPHVTTALTTLTQHGPACVDELKLPVACKRLRISRQACSIPAIVTGELASQVGGGLARQRACRNALQTNMSITSFEGRVAGLQYNCML